MSETASLTHQQWLDEVYDKLLAKMKAELGL